MPLVPASVATPIFTQVPGATPQTNPPVTPVTQSGILYINGADGKVWVSYPNPGPPPPGQSQPVPLYLWRPIEGHVTPPWMPMESYSTGDLVYRPPVGGNPGTVYRATQDIGPGQAPPEVNGGIWEVVGSGAAGTTHVAVSGTAGETPAAPGGTNVPQPHAGDWFINTADNASWVFDGTGWQPLTTVPQTAAAPFDPARTYISGDMAQDLRRHVWVATGTIQPSANVPGAPGASAMWQEVTTDVHDVVESDVPGEIPEDHFGGSAAGAQTPLFGGWIVADPLTAGAGAGTVSVDTAADQTYVNNLDAGGNDLSTRILGMTTGDTLQLLDTTGGNGWTITLTGAPTDMGGVVLLDGAATVIGTAPPLATVVRARITRAAAIPSTAKEGDEFINSADGKSWVFDEAGTGKWLSVGSRPSTITTTNTPGIVPPLAPPVAPQHGDLFVNEHDHIVWIYAEDPANPGQEAWLRASGETPTQVIVSSTAGETPATSWPALTPPNVGDWFVNEVDGTMWMYAIGGGAAVPPNMGWQPMTPNTGSVYVSDTAKEVPANPGAGETLFDFGSKPAVDLGDYLVVAAGPATGQLQIDMTGAQQHIYLWSTDAGGQDRSTELSALRRGDVVRIKQQGVNNWVDITLAANVGAVAPNAGASMVGAAVVHGTQPAVGVTVDAQRRAVVSALLEGDRFVNRADHTNYVYGPDPNMPGQFMWIKLPNDNTATVTTVAKQVPGVPDPGETVYQFARPPKVGDIFLNRTDKRMWVRVENPAGGGDIWEPMVLPVGVPDITGVPEGYHLAIHNKAAVWEPDTVTGVIVNTRTGQGTELTWSDIESQSIYDPAKETRVGSWMFAQSRDPQNNAQEGVLFYDATAGTMWFSDMDDGGMFGSTFPAVRVNDLIKITDAGDPTRWEIYLVTAAGREANGDHRLDVTLVGDGPGPTATAIGTTVEVEWITNPARAEQFLQPGTLWAVLDDHMIGPTAFPDLPGEAAHAGDFIYVHGTGAAKRLRLIKTGQRPAVHVANTPGTSPLPHVVADLGPYKLYDPTGVPFVNWGEVGISQTALIIGRHDDSTPRVNRDTELAAIPAGGMVRLTGPGGTPVIDFVLAAAGTQETTNYDFRGDVVGGTVPAFTNGDHFQIAHFAPALPGERNDEFINTADKKAWIHDGTTWVELHFPGGTMLVADEAARLALAPTGQPALIEDGTLVVQQDTGWTWRYQASMATDPFFSVWRVFSDYVGAATIADRDALAPHIHIGTLVSVGSKMYEYTTNPNAGTPGQDPGVWVDFGQVLNPPGLEGIIVPTAAPNDPGTVKWADINAAKLAATPSGSYFVVADATAQVPAGVPSVGGQNVKAGDWLVAIDGDGDGTSDAFHIVSLPAGTRPLVTVLTQAGATPAGVTTRLVGTTWTLDHNAAPPAAANTIQYEGTKANPTEFNVHETPLTGTPDLAATFVPGAKIRFTSATDATAWIEFKIQSVVHANNIWSLTPTSIVEGAGWLTSTGAFAVVADVTVPIARDRDDVVYNETDGRMWIATDTAWVEVRDLTHPIELYVTLPTNPQQGAMTWLTYEGQAWSWFPVGVEAIVREVAPGNIIPAAATATGKKLAGLAGQTLLPGDVIVAVDENNDGVADRLALVRRSPGPLQLYVTLPANPPPNAMTFATYAARGWADFQIGVPAVVRQVAAGGVLPTMTGLPNLSGLPAEPGDVLVPLDQNGNGVADKVVHVPQRTTRTFINEFSPNEAPRIYIDRGLAALGLTTANDVPVAVDNKVRGKWDIFIAGECRSDTDLSLIFHTATMTAAFPADAPAATIDGKTALSPWHVKANTPWFIRVSGIARPYSHWHIEFTGQDAAGHRVFDRVALEDATGNTGLPVIGVNAAAGNIYVQAMSEYTRLAQ